MKNLVSINIPSYNVSKTISKTLDSLASQSYKKIHITVVDNCSTDGTKNIIYDYERENKIAVICNASNIGGEANFEKCLHLGEGDYTAIYHADDVYNYKIVEQQAEFLASHSGCGVVLTRANFINDDDKTIGISKTFKDIGIKNKVFYIFKAPDLIKKLMRYGNFLITPSAMFRSEIAKNKIKHWNEKSFGTSADLDVWLRAAELGGLGLLEEPLMSYRLSYNQGGYNYNKSRIEESDFLKVMKYWIEKDNIKSELNSKDYFYFEGLKKADQLLCGIRAYLKNDKKLGAELLRHTFHKSFFVSFRYKYLFLWLMSVSLKYSFLRDISMPILKKILAKKHVG